MNLSYFLNNCTKVSTLIHTNPSLERFPPGSEQYLGGSQYEMYRDEAAEALETLQMHSNFNLI